MHPVIPDTPQKELIISISFPASFINAAKGYFRVKLMNQETLLTKQRVERDNPTCKF